MTNRGPEIWPAYHVRAYTKWLIEMSRSGECDCLEGTCRGRRGHKDLVDCQRSLISEYWEGEADQ